MEIRELGNALGSIKLSTNKQQNEGMFALKLKEVEANKKTGENQVMKTESTQKDSKNVDSIKDVSVKKEILKKDLSTKKEVTQASELDEEVKELAENSDDELTLMLSNAAFTSSTDVLYIKPESEDTNKETEESISEMEFSGNIILPELALVLNSTTVEAPKTDEPTEVTFESVLDSTAISSVIASQPHGTKKVEIFDSNTNTDFVLENAEGLIETVKLEQKTDVEKVESGPLVEETTDDLLKQFEIEIFKATSLNIKLEPSQSEKDLSSIDRPKMNKIDVDQIFGKLNINLAEVEMPRVTSDVKANFVNMVRDLPRPEVTILNQIVTTIRNTEINPGQTMNIKLSPEHLGELDLKVTVHNDTVKAEIKVETQIVRAVVESSLTELKQNLQEKGFNITQLSVDLGQKENKEQTNKGSKQKKSTFVETLEEKEESFISALDESTVVYYT